MTDHLDERGRKMSTEPIEASGYLDIRLSEKFPELPYFHPATPKSGASGTPVAKNAEIEEL